MFVGLFPTAFWEIPFIRSTYEVTDTGLLSDPWLYFALPSVWNIPMLGIK
jgi:hypothetical protein